MQQEFDCELTVIKSYTFYLYSPKSQSHCLRVLHKLHSECSPLSLEPRFELGKSSLLGKTSIDQHVLCFGAGMLVTRFSQMHTFVKIQ